jgi:hypothetical protein
VCVCVCVTGKEARGYGEKKSYTCVTGLQQGIRRGKTGDCKPGKSRVDALTEAMCPGLRCPSSALRNIIRSLPHRILKMRSPLTACVMLVFRLAFSSTLKMEATCSSETLVDFHWTTRRYIPEDIIFIATAVRSSIHSKVNHNYEEFL